MRQRRKKRRLPRGQPKTSSVSSMFSSEVPSNSSPGKKSASKTKDIDNVVGFCRPVSSSQGPNGEIWVPVKNPDQHDRKLLGVRLMRSTRWFPRSTTKVAMRGLPYIMPSGHISGSTLYYWKCSSAQWFATLCRSVLKNLLKRNTKKSMRKKLSRDAIARIAVYYSVSNSESDLERLLHCRVKDVRRLLHYYICKLDDQQRFLYDQMCNSISWLQSRGSPRAQSVEKFEIPDYRGFWTFDTIRDISIQLNFISDPWIIGKIRLT